MVLKVALIGYGKMGQMIEKVSAELDCEIVAKIDSRKEKGLELCDVCIDFSTPDAVLQNVNLALEASKPIVVGTTGWAQDFEKVKKQVMLKGGSLLYSPNFSLGVALFFSLVKEAARLFAPFEEYDMGVEERHHKHKLDSPSGTAKAINDILLQETSRNPLPISAIRLGHIPGSHTVIFDSEVDTITLTHEARSREGFAKGALKAAHWLKNKQGFYTLNDMIAEQILCKSKASSQP